MTKAFSEREKEIIKAKILEKGKELLCKFGIKKTSVEDITKATGISKGAFYLFYPSKEELFFEIFEQYEKDMRKNLQIEFNVVGKLPREIFKDFIKNMLLQLINDPMIKNFTNQEMEYLLRKLPPEKIQEHMKNDDNYVLEFYNSLKVNNIANEYDEKVVSALFRSIVLMCIRKDEIGTEVFPDLIDMWAGMISNYLIKE